ncbi:MAG: oxygen-independent coproporphyrinogen III oxidase [Roseovarius sp.]
MIAKDTFAALGLYDAKVPRYTSYPTAPHFGTDVDPEVFSGWIRAIPENAAISLYVHVPFCRRLCWFCACRTQGTQKLDPVRSYLETLKAELTLLADHLPKGVTLSRLHWGGGTPTLLDADMITALADAIKEVVPFNDTTEFSVEIDPNELDTSRLNALVAAGMNRASIGVQDFDPEIQTTIGRIQPFDLTRHVVDQIRAAGVASLNADILFGLPDQTPERMSASVQKLLSLSPDRVALYGYAHVPWMAKRQQLIPEDKLPKSRDRLHLFETARELFVWDGYEEIGIDHFARPTDSMAKAQAQGTLRRNFQGYTDDTAAALIGVGASSISKFPQGYAQNAPATGKHVAAIRNGQFSTARGHVFSPQDNLRGRMIEALMCDFAINSTEMQRHFGVSAAHVHGILSNTDKSFPGLLQLTDKGLFVPPEARPLTRLIARTLDSYDLSRAGHSPAI